MSHVDEGHLHAWLDGALDHYPADEAERVRRHLAGCEVCAARLEEARALRGRTKSILDGAAPEPGPLPELEALRAEAGRRVRDRDRSSSLRRLAWAASVVVALGAGWMAREVTAPGGLTGPPSASGLSGAPAAPADTERDAGEASRARAEEEAGVPPSPAVAEREAAPAQEPADGSAEAREDPAADRGVDRASPTEPGALEAVVPRTAAERDVASGPPPALSAAPLRRRAVADSAALVARPVQGAAGNVARESAAWAGPPAGEGRAPLAVPGAPVLAADRRAGPSGGTIVRVLQRLPEGDTVEILHLLGGADPAALEPLGPGRTEWSEAVDGGWLILRSRRDREGLRELATLVRP